MAANPTTLLRRAIRSVAGGEASDATDAELLRRFSRDRDQEAFALLVSRHAGMVFGVCLRSLPTVQDAEDACQATFLLLSQKAGSLRWQPSIANWLYVTGRRVARNTRVVAQRRAKREARAAVPEVVSPVDRMTVRELLSILDQELEQLPPMYREPLVLCYLEGLPRDEVATRLGVAAATLRTRLDRGRKRLHEALTKVGVALGVGLLSVAVTSPVRASSPRIVKAILQTVLGPVPETVAELTKGVAVDGILRKSLLAVVGLVAIVVVGLGLGSATFTAAGPPPREPHLAAIHRPPRADKEPPITDKEVVVSGRVLSPEDKPVAGAVIAVGDWKEEKGVVTDLGKTDADGRFRYTLPPPLRKGPRSLVARADGFAADWIALPPGTKPDADIVLKLSKASVPVRGRVLTLEGQPVPKAVVSINRVYAPDGKITLKQVYETWPSDPDRGAHLMQKTLGYPTAAGLPDEVTVDVEGRFEIKGIGDGRLLMLRITADAIEQVYIRVAVDAAFDPKAIAPDPTKVDPQRPPRPGPPLYGPTFDHAGRPCRPITGTVTDQKTGKPLANVAISGHLPPGQGWWENGSHTRTDANGKYRLLGLPNALCDLGFGQGGETPYLSLMKTVEPTVGLEAATCDMTMVRGVVVTGQVIDKATGKPIHGGVQYAPLFRNQELVKLPGQDPHTRGALTHSLDAEGRFRFVAPRGPGILVVQAELREGGQKPYAQVRIKPEDREKEYFRTDDGLGELYITAAGYYIPLIGWHAYQVIEPKEDEDKVKVELTLDPGRSVEGKVIGPDGQPFAGATVAGLSPTWEWPVKQDAATFTAYALVAGEKRQVAALHAEKKLAGMATVTLDDKEALMIKLAPWGAITGRLFQEGKPVAGAELRLRFSERVAERLYSPLAEGKGIVTDKDGRFRVDVPFADTLLYVGFSYKGKRLGVGPEFKNPMVQAGSTKDLGDIAVTLED